MSEEEKKAIEYLKTHIIPCHGYKGRIEFMLNDVILNLIEKQQKEIEELKNTETYKIAIIDKDKYISKDKIKEIIERLRKQHKNIFDAQMLYKELLGEKIKY